MIYNIETMNQVKGQSKLNGAMNLRQQDQRLTWNPADWAGINGIQVNNQDIWKPDLTVTNHINRQDQEFNEPDSLVRVHAIRSDVNDVDEHIFNIEQSPIITLEVHHEFDMQQFPIDTQDVQVHLESWMTTDLSGQVKLMGLSKAISSTDDISFSENENESLSIQKVWADQSSIDWFGKLFQTVDYHIIVQRKNQKQFTSIQVPSIVVMYLALLNIMINDRSIKVQNSITLLIVNTLFLTLNQEIIPASTMFGLQELGIISMFCLIFYTTIMDQVSHILESKIDDIIRKSKSNQGESDVQNEISMPYLITYKQRKSLIQIHNSTIILLAVGIIINLQIFLMALLEGIYLYVTTVLNVLICSIIASLQRFQKNGLKQVDYLSQITQIQRKNKKIIDEELFNEINKELNMEYSFYGVMPNKIDDKLYKPLLVEILSKIFEPQMISKSHLLNDSFNYLLDKLNNNQESQISKQDLVRILLSLTNEFGGEFTDKNFVDNFIFEKLTILNTPLKNDKEYKICEQENHDKRI